MRIRPGRVHSLITGIVVLIVTIAGLFVIPTGLGWFRVIWAVIGLVSAGLAFFNAFSRRGLPIYEVDAREPETYCPECGTAVGEGDRFCRQCGESLN